MMMMMMMIIIIIIIIVTITITIKITITVTVTIITITVISIIIIRSVMAEAASRSHARRPARIKWTDNMLQDLQACKDKAIGLTNSENPPLLRNGRKKGYRSFATDVITAMLDDL